MFSLHSCAEDMICTAWTTQSDCLPGRLVSQERGVGAARSGSVQAKDKTGTYDERAAEDQRTVGTVFCTVLAALHVVCLVANTLLMGLCVFVIFLGHRRRSLTYIPRSSTPAFSCLRRQTVATRLPARLCSRSLAISWCRCVNVSPSGVFDLRPLQFVFTPVLFSFLCVEHGGERRSSA